MMVGWGPYLRDLAITGNVIRDAGLGMAVTVVEGAGKALISDNVFSDTPGGAIVGAAVGTAPQAGSSQLEQAPRFLVGSTTCFGFGYPPLFRLASPPSS